MFGLFSSIMFNNDKSYHKVDKHQFGNQLCTGNMSNIVTPCVLVSLLCATSSRPQHDVCRCFGPYSSLVRVQG